MVSYKNLGYAAEMKRADTQSLPVSLMLLVFYLLKQLRYSGKGSDSLIKLSNTNHA